MSQGYRVFKVPGRSRAALTTQASQLVRRHFPECWSTPRPVPVRDFLEGTLHKYGIDYGVVDSLSLGEEGKIIAVGSEGRPEILIPELVMNELYADKTRARFTTAHEVAHGILHGAYITTVLVENNSPRLYRREDIKAYEDPEWQANVFAGAFLMPTQAVLAFVKSEGAHPWWLAEALNVSRKAAEVRLHYLARQGMLK